VFDFRIHSVQDEKDLMRLRSFLLGQGLSYPDYERWVEDVCVPEIEAGFKSAILAWNNGHVVGDAVYQPHKQLPRTREFKNLRVHPSLRRRDLAHFMIRQMEEEDRASFDRVICDARDPDVVQFMQFCGYRSIMALPLYDTNFVDTVMSKEFSRYDSPLHL
jgi:hypothetical protein